MKHLLTAILALVIGQSAVQAAIDIWTMPATLKITRDAKPPGNQPPAIALAGAKHEVVAAQIAVSSDLLIVDLDANVSTLSGPGGDIYSDRVSLWQENFVDTNKGKLPDA